MGYSASDVRYEVQGAFEIPGVNRIVVSLRAKMQAGLLGKIKQFVHNAAQREASRYPLPKNEGMTGWLTSITEIAITKQNGAEVNEITIVLDIRPAFSHDAGDGVEIIVGQPRVEEGAGGG